MKIFKKKITVEVPIENNEANKILLDEIKALKAENAKLKNANTRLKSKEVQLNNSLETIKAALGELNQMQNLISGWTDNFPNLFAIVNTRIENGYHDDL